jgi:hypothetical protein
MIIFSARKGGSICMRYLNKNGKNPTLLFDSSEIIQINP